MSLLLNDTFIVLYCIVCTILNHRVDTVNQDSERMARKLCIVDQAGTNDVIAESFRQFNTMVEELHAAHKDVSISVCVWL